MSQTRLLIPLHKFYESCHRLFIIQESFISNNNSSDNQTTNLQILERIDVVST